MASFKGLKPVVFVIICRRYFVIICRNLGGNEGARSAVCGEA